MNKLRSVVLRKCKSLSRLGRSTSYSSLRSLSAKEADAAMPAWHEGLTAAASETGAVVFVGSSRRRYVISAKHLSHPLIAALIDHGDGCREDVDCRRRSASSAIAVNCEVVLFDHLLWMLDNAVDLRDDGGPGAVDDDALRELAELYAC